MKKKDGVYHRQKNDWPDNFYGDWYMLFLTCKERIIRNISNSYQAEGHLANENVNCRFGKVSGFSCLLSNRKHFLQKYDS